MTSPHADLQFGLRFDGATFNQVRDGERLTSELERVKELMLDGKWRTLAEIAKHVHGNEAHTTGISARLRDLRKPRFGGFKVERQYVIDGVWQYRMEA